MAFLFSFFEPPVSCQRKPASFVQKARPNMLNFPRNALELRANNAVQRNVKLQSAISLSFDNIFLVFFRDGLSETEQIATSD